MVRRKEQAELVLGAFRPGHSVARCARLARRTTWPTRAIRARYALYAARSVCAALAARSKVLALQVGQDDPGPLDHAARQPSHARHLDTITAVAAAGHHLPQENDLVVLLPDSHVVVGDPVETRSQFDQFVVMRGEEGLGRPFGRVVEELRDRPGDAQPVEGARAPADLVEEDEASRRRVVEDVGGLVHLDEKGAFASGQVVGGADAREDAVHDADPRGPRWDEGTDLGHEYDQAHLAEIGALAGHVRSGDEGDLLRPGVELRIVGDEGFALQQLLHHRVASIVDLQDGSVFDLRGRVVVPGGQFGQRGQEVQLRDRSAIALDLAQARGHFLPEFEEKGIFQLPDLFLGAQDLLLVFLELRGDEPLRVAHGLLADVLAFQPVQVRFGDLDVVAEHAVVVDLEGLDPRALPFLLLQFCDPAFSARADRAQVVEFLVVSRPDEPAFRKREGRIVNQRPIQFLRQGFEFPQSVPEACGQFGFQAFECFPDDRDHVKGGLQRDQVAGIRPFGPDPGRQALQVPHGLEQVRERVPRAVLRMEFAHRPLAGQDGIGRNQRPGDRLAHESGAHGRVGPVHHGEERAFAASVPQRGNQLQVALGLRVHQHGVRDVVAGHGLQVGQPVLLGLPEIDQHAARRGDACGHFVAAESLERQHLEMI